MLGFNLIWLTDGRCVCVYLYYDVLYNYSILVSLCWASTSSGSPTDGARVYLCAPVCTCHRDPSQRYPSHRYPSHADFGRSDPGRLGRLMDDALRPAVRWRPPLVGRVFHFDQAHTHTHSLSLSLSHTHTETHTNTAVPCNLQLSTRPLHDRPRAGAKPPPARPDRRPARPDRRKRQGEARRSHGAGGRKAGGGAAARLPAAKEPTRIADSDSRLG